MQGLVTERAVAGLATTTPRSVRRRACELITEHAPRVATNGRQPRLYQIRSLSPKLQEAWLAEQQKSVDHQPAEEPVDVALTLPTGLNFSAEDEAEAKRRYGIIEAILAPDRFQQLWIQNELQKSKLIDFLAREHQLGRRTIYGWLKAFEGKGLAGLIRKGRSDKGIPQSLNQMALEFIVAQALPRPGIFGEASIREIYRAYHEERTWRAAHADKKLTGFDERNYARYVDPETGCLKPSVQLPDASYETFRFWYRKIPEPVKVLARQGKDAFHNSQEVLSFRSLSEIQPLDYLVMDDRRLDIFCLVRSRDGWTLLRPWLTAALDMRTRKWLAWAIVQVPSSDSIASVLKQVFVKWGVPQAVYWDNGKTYTCEWLEGRNPRTRSAPCVGELKTGMRGVLETLGVRIHHAIVRRARSKLIEPQFVNVANYDRTLPWWCGHKPTARPERFQGLLDDHERWLQGKLANPPFPTIEQVADLYNEFLESLNEREHSGEGMQKILPTGRGWLCPNEAWEILIPKVKRRTVPADVLQFCFHKRRKVTVRHGELCLSFGGRQYHYRLTESPIELMRLNGREVEFTYDPLDLGLGVCYSQGRFVGLVTNVEARRMAADDFVQDERDRRASQRQIKNIIQTIHQQVYIPGVAERATRRAAVQPVRPDPERPEVPLAIPRPLLEASEAAERDKAFSFANAADEPDLIRQLDARAHQDDDPDDTEFQFFTRAENDPADA